MADTLEMGSNEVIKMLIDHGADLATIKSTVSRLDTILGNGNGLIRQVSYNRELCDKRAESCDAREAHARSLRAYDKMRDVFSDKIKRRPVVSMAVSGTAITAIFEGVKALWPIIFKH